MRYGLKSSLKWIFKNILHIQGRVEVQCKNRRWICRQSLMSLCVFRWFLKAILSALLMTFSNIPWTGIWYSSVTLFRSVFSSRISISWKVFDEEGSTVFIWFQDLTPTSSWCDVNIHSMTSVYHAQFFEKTVCCPLTGGYAHTGHTVSFLRRLTKQEKLIPLSCSISVPFLWLP